MKHIFYYVIAMFIACSCGCCQQMPTDSFSKMVTEYERIVSVEQFDSICAADSITNNVAKWIPNYYQDGETGKIFTQYLFIISDSLSETVYRYEKTDNDSIWISKRVKK